MLHRAPYEVPNLVCHSLLRLSGTWGRQCGKRLAEAGTQFAYNFEFLLHFLYTSTFSLLATAQRVRATEAPQEGKPRGMPPGSQFLQQLGAMGLSRINDIVSATRICETGCDNPAQPPSRSPVLWVLWDGPCSGRGCPLRPWMHRCSLSTNHVK